MGVATQIVTVNRAKSALIDHSAKSEPKRILDLGIVGIDRYTGSRKIPFSLKLGLFCRSEPARDEASSHTASISSTAGWLLQDLWSFTQSAAIAKPVGASLLAKGPSATPHQLLRQQVGSHRICGRSQDRRPPQIPVGASWLVGSPHRSEGAINHNASISSRASPLPQGSVAIHRISGHRSSPVGAGLPAMRSSATPHQLHRQQAGSYRDLRQITESAVTAAPLWELACQR